jgi:hypothetical protein
MSNPPASTEFWHVVRWWKTEAEAYRKCRLDVGEEGPPAVWDGVEPNPCVRSGGAESSSLLGSVLIGLDHCIVGHFHGSLQFLHQVALQLVRCVAISPFLGVLAARVSGSFASSLENCGSWALVPLKAFWR